MWTMMLTPYTLVVILATAFGKDFIGNFKSNMDKIGEKAASLSVNTEKIGNFKNDVTEFLNKPDLPTMDSKVGGAIESVGGGAITLYNGIANNKWQDIVVGALGIIGGIAVFAGPYGVVLSSVLKVVSSLFGLISNDEKAEESQESMIERVINEALEKTRIEDLKAQAEGLKKAILSIRNSISQFRDTQNISKNEAYEMYTQVFRGLDFLGRLKYEIDKFCKCSFDIEKALKEEGDSKIFKDQKKKSNNCLSLLNLYSDITVYRHLLIADMASLFFTIGSKENNSDVKKTGENLISFSEKERVSDKNILLFLFDPINNHEKRFCIAQYFGSPSKYPTIMPYLMELKELPGVHFPAPNIVFCSNVALTGLCYRYKYTKDFEKITAKELNWTTLAKSVYISDKVMLREHGDDGAESFYYGPTVIGNKKMHTNGYFILDKAEVDAGEVVRVCEKFDFDQTGICEQVRVGEKTINYNDGIGSMFIPEEAIVKIEPPENSENDAFIGPFYGPNNIDEFCQRKLGKSILVIKKSSIDENVLNMVKVCRGVSFTIQCEYLEINNYGRMKINECDYWGKSRIKSMVVPEGLMVEMWTEDNFLGLKLGPYIGPLSLPTIEGVNSGENGDKILSMKVCKRTEKEIC
ncbi:uncharacterized protein LOC136087324 [Hydra vulgaris]|uniref:Uncharacterized protein LOC136087324 n=1 Tax=Hydra vulgaris TaxID=6087 RepID=A0ABM4CV65_HYDVU